MGGDEGHEDHEGHEGEEGVGDRQGEAREGICVPRVEGEDLHGAEEDRPDEDQDREDLTKKQHAAGKKAYANIKGWTLAVQKARKALGVKGFKAVKKGSPLYKKAKELYGQ